MNAKCQTCQGDCRLTDGAEVYPNRTDLAALPIHVCDKCKTRVGCHPGTTTPLGTAADRATRNARSMLHAVIDPIWRDGKNRANRPDVYAYMAHRLGIHIADCHVGHFDAPTCVRAATMMRSVNATDVKKWADAQMFSSDETEVS